MGIGLANLVAAFAPGLTVVVVGRALAGGLTAALFPTTLVYVGDRVPFGPRQRVVANLLAAGAVGTVLSTFGAGVLAGFATWRLVFLALAVLALILAVVIRRLPESLPGALGAGPVTQIRRVCADGWTLFLFVLALVEWAATAGFFTFMAPALEASGKTPAVAGLVVSAQGVAVFAGLQLVKRCSRGSILSPSSSSSSVEPPWSSLTCSPPSNKACATSSSPAWSSAWPLPSSTPRCRRGRPTSRARGTAMALFVTGLFLGAAMATAVVSGLADAHHYRKLFLVAAGVALVVVVVASVAQPRYAAARGPRLEPLAGPVRGMKANEA